jgi:hypothetical protein
VLLCGETQLWGGMAEQQAKYQTGDNDCQDNYGKFLIEEYNQNKFVVVNN